MSKFVTNIIGSYFHTSIIYDGKTTASVKNCVFEGTLSILHRYLFVQNSNTHLENGNNISALLFYLRLRHLLGIRFMYEYVYLLGHRITTGSPANRLLGSRTDMLV